METEQLRLDDQALTMLPVGIRLSIYSKQSEEDEAREGGEESPLRVYTYGQRLHFIAKLRTPRNYRNPGAMDMAGYLNSQGIRLTGSARASYVEVLAWLRRHPLRPAGVALLDAVSWRTFSSSGRASAAR